MIDLGSAPPSNSYLSESSLSLPELWYPLRVLVCENCWLAQTEDFVEFDSLFDDNYAYFSSYSESWLRQSENYVSAMVDRFELDESSKIVEVAANDGYLLQFAAKKGIPSLGIEPTASTAAAARQKGIEIVEEFFSTTLAKKLAIEGHCADLTVANNVLAHVPQINDFVAGFAKLLKPNGVATFEFPHLLNLIKFNQFDTIYHEHFSYLSLTALTSVFPQNGLTIFDVEELTSHGGSLRVFAQRSDTGDKAISDSVAGIVEAEKAAGLTNRKCYEEFEKRAESAKDEFVSFLIGAKKDGKQVAAYGAAAKGNTIMNYAGLRKDSIPFVFDRNPAKLGKFMPGSRIPIVNESKLKLLKPNYLVILPWNLKEELSVQLSYVTEWGGKLVTVIPSLNII